VLLYSIGQDQINPVGNMIYERVMLEGLEDGDKVSGGVLTLKGRFCAILIASLYLPNFCSRMANRSVHVC